MRLLDSLDRALPGRAAFVRALRSLRTIGLGCLGALVASSLGSACSRRADILDEPETEVPAGNSVVANTTEVKVGLNSPELTVCAERVQTGECSNGGDFPCDFPPWLRTFADKCQALTGCVTEGWVVAELGAGGCIDHLRMSHPNEAFAACLGSYAATTRCPCGAMSTQLFLSKGGPECQKDRPRSCGPAEFPCPSGQVCVDGVCEPDLGAGGSR